MKKRIFIFSALFIFFVIALAPASLINRMIPSATMLNYEAIEGTLWSGQIESVQFKSLQLGNVDYSLSFFRLLTGRLGTSLQLKDGDIDGDLFLLVSNEKSLSIADANLSAKAFIAESLIRFPGIELNGNLATENLDLAIENLKPIQAEGATSWTNASLKLSGQDWQLGNFIINWRTEEESGDIIGEISNAVNKLGLRGSLTLKPDGMFEFIGSIAQTAEKPIYDTMSLFADGKPAAGRLPLKFKKKLF